ncbi:hypothetical protein VTN00DRAFT_3971 [Thermoascus crustaceus]|uniref:uncharacterized protein n=1 Tax=Thermoascus crustaceus TaxID=5088 RepID=UPI0037420683
MCASLIPASQISHASVEEENTKSIDQTPLSLFSSPAMQCTQCLDLMQPCALEKEKVTHASKRVNVVRICKCNANGRRKYAWERIMKYPDPMHPETPQN